MISIDRHAAIIHQTSADHGFWDKPRNFGEMLMLAVSECAEALEEDREGNPMVYFKCVKCGNDFVNIYNLGDSLSELPLHCGEVAKPEGAFVEIIDAIIRLLDTAHDMAMKSGYKVSDVLSLKMEFNEQRAHMHGRKY